MELIAHIDQEVPEMKIEEEKMIAEELYAIDTTSARTFMLIIPDPTFNINQATFDVISYNIDYYTNKNYKTEGTLTDQKYIIITVSGFASFSQAKDYYLKFESAKPVRNPAGLKLMTFIIGGENMTRFRQDRNPERYDIFFRENFMKIVTSQVDTLK